MMPMPDFFGMMGGLMPPGLLGPQQPGAGGPGGMTPQQLLQIAQRSGANLQPPQPGGAPPVGMPQMPPPNLGAAPSPVAPPPGAPAPGGGPTLPPGAGPGPNPMMGQMNPAMMQHMQQLMAAQGQGMQPGQGQQMLGQGMQNPMLQNMANMGGMMGGGQMSGIPPSLMQRLRMGLGASGYAGGPMGGMGGPY
jgi:RNA-binding protein Musashi